MTIILTDKLKTYLNSKDFTCLRVDIVKKRSNCCAVGTPKVSPSAPPNNKLDLYHTYEQEGYTIYIDRLATYASDTITFDYSKLFMLELIEAHGFEFERML